MTTITNLPLCRFFTIPKNKGMKITMHDFNFCTECAFGLAMITFKNNSQKYLSSDSALHLWS